MIGHEGICKGIQAMLVDKLGGMIAGMGVSAPEPPRSILLDTRRAYRVDALPVVEIIPQRLVQLRTENTDGEGDAYRCVYAVRIDVGTAFQPSYEDVASERLRLLLAVRQTLLRWPDMGAYVGYASESVGIESISITEDIGPITEHGSGHWYGQATINLVAFAIEVLAVPALAVGPMDVFVTVELMTPTMAELATTLP